MKVESALVAYLSRHLGCRVATDVPNPRPACLVTVDRTGGGKDSIVIERPTVAVQCWAPTRSDAQALAQEAEDAMDALPETDWCYRASKNSDHYFPGEGDEPRWQLVYDLACDPR